MRPVRENNHGEIIFACWVGPQQELFWNSNQNVPVQNTSAFSGLAEYSGDLLRMQYNDIRLNCTVVSSSECNTITFDQSEARKLSSAFGRAHHTSTHCCDVLQFTVYYVSNQLQLSVLI